MCLQTNKPISPKLVANYFSRRFRPPICAANPHTFRPHPSLFGSEQIVSFRFPPKEPRFENEESIEKESIEIFEVVRKRKYCNF